MFWFIFGSKFMRRNFVLWYHRGSKCSWGWVIGLLTRFFLYPTQCTGWFHHSLANAQLTSGQNSVWIDGTLESDSFYCFGKCYVGMDSWQVDNTKRAKLGSNWDPFPPVCGPTNIFLQKRLHIWWSCSHEVTWWCGRAWNLWGIFLAHFTF